MRPIKIHSPRPGHCLKTDNAFMDHASLVQLLDRALWATPPVTTHMLIRHHTCRGLAFCMPHTPLTPRTATRQHHALTTRLSSQTRASLHRRSHPRRAGKRRRASLHTRKPSHVSSCRIIKLTAGNCPSHITETPQSTQMPAHFHLGHRKSVVDCGAHHLHMLHMIKGTSTAPTTAPLQRLSALKHFVHRTGHRRIVDHLRRLARC